MTILVTGGTGTLGRPTTALLRAAGHDLRVLSRHPGDGRVVGDLATGAGVAAAIAEADTVLHLANGGFKEAEQTERLIAAFEGTAVRHLIYISIVGVDRNPFAYYRQKLASERVVEKSGVPFTILRATQFHEFVSTLLEAQRRLPAVFAPKIPLQPIAVEEVAARLVELVAAGPSGHVADIEGPEQKQCAEFAEQWFAAQGRARRIWRVGFPGKAGRAFREGVSLGSLPGYGTRTFAEFAAAHAAETAPRSASR